MMKLLKVCVFAALVTTTAVAQEQVSGITWNIGLPTGRMSEFMNKTSFGGFGFEFGRYVDDNLSLGFSFSWNIWSEMTGDVIELQNGALSGTQIRYYNSFPILLNARYYLSEDKRAEFKPYMGLNVGTYYILQRMDIGSYSFQNDHWHFGLAPEAGFMFEVSRGTYLSASARYNYAFDSGSTLGGKDDNSLAYWGINLGFIWNTGWF